MERRAGHETVIPIQKQGMPKLPYLEAFEITDKTPKAQMVTIVGWNGMRERLLALGEMEQK